MFNRSSLIAPTAALAAAFAAALAAAPVSAGPGGEQGQARREVQAGTMRSLREIEARVLPMMGNAQYLGPEYDPTVMAYRLKFIRSGRVIFVDIDARSGEVLRQTQ